MPQKCVINQCKNIQRKNCGISFFRFPLSDEVLLAKWITAVYKTHSPVTASSKICERHFKKEFFSGKERKRLKINAVPTEYLMLQVDPLRELNVINLYKYGQINTGCRKKIPAKDASSSSVDIHITSDPVEEIAAKDTSSSSVDIHIASDSAEDVMHTNKCAFTNTTDNQESQIKVLKAENERLTALVQSLKDDHTKQLQHQADMFQYMLQNQKKVMQNKLTSALTKVKLLRRQRQRLNVKLIDILRDVRNNKILRKESLNFKQ